MTVQVVSSTAGDDATACIAGAHEQLLLLDAQLCSLWSAHVASDPIVADQLAVAARYVRKAAGALSEQRLA